MERYVVKLAGGKERIITDTHDLGMVSFEEAIEYSSNIVMAKVSDLVGAEGLYTKARDFGFGTPSGIELPGEAEGELKKAIAMVWHDAEHAWPTGMR